MLIRLERFKQTQRSTIGQFSIDGSAPVCYALEDAHHTPKIPGSTRIPAGTYPIALRTVGGFHTRYLKRFGADFHKGMLWIRDVPGFEFILIHCGNTIADTDGCPLTGSAYELEGDAFTITRSEIAYRELYPIPRDAMGRGEPVWISVIDPPAAEGPLVA